MALVEPILLLAFSSVVETLPPMLFIAFTADIAIYPAIIPYSTEDAARSFRANVIINPMVYAILNVNIEG